MVKLNKKRIIITTALLSCAVFAVLIAAEKKIVNSSPKKQIYVAAKDINQGEFLNASDFILEDKAINNITDDMVTSLNGIKSKYATQNIYKEEPLNKNTIADKNDSSKMFLKPGEREFSIPLTKLDNDAFAGTLRRGDIVDITHTSVATQGAPVPITELTGKRVRVLGAVDLQGKFLEPNDKNVLAAAIMFAGDEDSFVKTSKESSAGAFKIAKCPIYSESNTSN
ncbi:Flp pilus assembly protein CpaB [Clostridium neuense]|uniref:Flp pilus assembly protein CpaB n=1 Tax=Clostridium neuense TaxID=1728934 RepID=A0ABW8TI74_9CLOT